MSIKVILKQKGLTKRKITIQEIASLLELSYGITNEHYCLDEDVIGNITLLFNKNKLARGIEVSVENYDVLLRLNLPTTLSEIDLFYRLIEKICELLQKRYFVKDDVLYTLDEINTCIENDANSSIHTLNMIKEKLIHHEVERFILFGVMNPISIGLKEINEINGNLHRLEEFLERLQRMDIFYATPHIYKRKDNSLFGGYFIGEDIETVVPIKPHLLMNSQDVVDDWYVFFPEKKIIDYDFFIKNVAYSYYDENHVIVYLTRNDINELFDQKYDEMNRYS